MNITDVREFYQRTDAFKARGGEGPCAGCGKVLEPEQPFSVYDLAGKERTPRAYPPSIILCHICTFMVIPVVAEQRPPAEPSPPEDAS